MILGSYGDVLRERDILEPFETELRVTRFLTEDANISVKTTLKRIHANLGMLHYCGAGINDCFNFCGFRYFELLLF